MIHDFRARYSQIARCICSPWSRSSKYRLEDFRDETLSHYQFIWGIKADNPKDNLPIKKKYFSFTLLLNMITRIVLLTEIISFILEFNNNIFAQ